MTTPYQRPIHYPAIEGKIASVDRRVPGRPSFIVEIKDPQSGASLQVRASCTIEQFYANNLNHVGGGESVILQEIEGQMVIVRWVGETDDFVRVTADPNGVETRTEIEPAAIIEGNAGSVTVKSSGEIVIAKGQGTAVISGERLDLQYTKEKDPTKPDDRTQVYFLSIDANGVAIHGSRSGIFSLTEDNIDMANPQGSIGTFVVADPTLPFGTDNYRFVLTTHTPPQHINVYAYDQDNNTIDADNIIGRVLFSDVFDTSDKLLCNDSARFTDTERAELDLLVSPDSLKTNTVVRRGRPYRGRDANLPDVYQLQYEWKQPVLPTNETTAGLSYNLREFGYETEDPTIINQIIVDSIADASFTTDVSSNLKVIERDYPHAGTLADAQLLNVFDTDSSRRDRLRTGLIALGITIPAAILTAVTGGIITGAAPFLASTLGTFVGAVPGVTIITTSAAGITSFGGVIGGGFFAFGAAAATTGGVALTIAAGGASLTLGLTAALLTGVTVATVGTIGGVGVTRALQASDIKTLAIHGFQVQSQLHAGDNNPNKRTSDWSDAFVQFGFLLKDGVTIASLSAPGA